MYNINILFFQSLSLIFSNYYIPEYMYWSDFKWKYFSKFFEININLFISINSRNLNIIHLPILFSSQICGISIVFIRNSNFEFIEMLYNVIYFAWLSISYGNNRYKFKPHIIGIYCIFVLKCMFAHFHVFIFNEF